MITFQALKYRGGSVYFNVRMNLKIGTLKKEIMLCAIQHEPQCKDSKEVK